MGPDDPEIGSLARNRGTKTCSCALRPVTSKRSTKVSWPGPGSPTLAAPIPARFFLLFLSFYEAVRR